MAKDFDQILDSMLQDDARYERGVYQFIREALEYTFKSLTKVDDLPPGKHVSGGDLVAGVRDYALGQYGPMAKTVLNAWGVKTSEDLGNVVFNLIDHGVFAKSEEDSLEDFKDVLDFDDAFVRPFLPIKKNGGADVNPNNN